MSSRRRATASARPRRRSDRAGRLDLSKGERDGPGVSRQESEPTALESGIELTANARLKLVEHADSEPVGPISSGVWPTSARVTPGDDVATFAIHDAKNLACALRANVDWLRSVCVAEFPRADVLEALQEITEGCARLIDLTQDALSARREHAAGLTITPTSVHLLTLLGCAVDRVRKLADASNIAIEVRGPEDLTAGVDRALFSRVVDNLLDNAIRASEEGGFIAVCFGESGPDVVLSVSDQGPGVPPALRERIFEMFRRGADEPASEAGRAGVGLAFCRAVAAAHGGSLVVDDAPGGGASFVVTIPSGRENHGGDQGYEGDQGGVVVRRRQR